MSNRTWNTEAGATNDILCVGKDNNGYRFKNFTSLSLPLSI